MLWKMPFILWVCYIIPDHIAGGSTPTPDQPPAPVAPVLNGDRENRDRRRQDSASTGQHSEKAERFELEESSEFLQSVDGELKIKTCFEKNEA